MALFYGIDLVNLFLHAVGLVTLLVGRILAIGGLCAMASHERWDLLLGIVKPTGRNVVPLEKSTGKLTLVPGLRRAVGLVCLVNTAYFVVESVMAHWIGSVALLADSIDFLEDGLLNGFVLLIMGWSYVARARVGKFMALLFVPPMLAVLFTTWRKLTEPAMPPPSSLLLLIALGAFCVNSYSAWLFLPFRGVLVSFVQAALLASRNDVLANVGVLLAGIVTHVWPSIWPDLIVGWIIAGLNIDAAGKVWRMSHSKEMNEML